MKTKLKDQKGFTIIEVLIVLAIAGLIMLIVFLAVPALQRNSRNTSYRSEGSQLLSAATEFITNNKNGTAPVASDSATAGSEAATIIGLTKNKNITALKVEARTGSQPTAPTLSKATLVVASGSTGAKCDTTTVGNVADGSTRQIALVYAIEDSGGNVVKQCIDA